MSAFKIAFINMPFANVHIPSIGMTQIQSVVKEQFGAEVELDIHYANQDFALFLGLDLYQKIVTDGEHLKSGVGAWIFRHIAFPEAPENTTEFMARFYPYNDERTLAFRKTMLEKRNGIDALLDRLIDDYGLLDCDLVGFSSMFQQNLAVFALAQKLKKIRPGIATIVGGANCEFPMGHTMVQNVPQLDYVFAGPSLVSFPKFLRHYIGGDLDACDSVAGVFSKTNVQRVLAANSCHDPKLWKFGDESPVGIIGEEMPINAYIPLDYTPFLDGLEKRFENENVEPVLLFETSRGCWWGEKAHCTFCGLNDATIAFRSMRPDAALRLFDSLFAFSDRCTRYMCVDNILPKQFLTEVLPNLKTPPGVTLFYEVKSDLKPKDMEALSAAGVRLVQPGIEALSSASLKLMRKGATAFQQIQFLKNCVLYDIFPTWNLLVGTPGEPQSTYEKYCDIIPILNHLPPPTGVIPVEFHRFSPNFERAKELGLELTPADFIYFSYPLPDDVLRSLVWNFEDRNLNAPYFVDLIHWLGRMKELVTQWQAYWYTQVEAQQPRLYLEIAEDETILIDGRRGAETRIVLKPSTASLLKALDAPLTVTALRGLWEKQGSNGNFDEELSWLRENRLVFEEEARIMSVVLSKAPPQRQAESAALATWSIDTTEYAEKKFDAAQNDDGRKTGLRKKARQVLMRF